MGERKRKKKHVGGKKENKKICAFATPRIELSPFTLSQLSNTVYTNALSYLTHRSAKRVCV